METRIRYGDFQTGWDGEGSYFEATVKEFRGQPTLFVDALFIAKENRGCGAGSAFLKLIEYVAHVQGCYSITGIVSAASDISEDWLVGFYERKGFKITEIVERDYSYLLASKTVAVPAEV